MLTLAENLKHVYLTRASDIDEVFVFTDSSNTGILETQNKHILWIQDTWSTKEIEEYDIIFLNNFKPAYLLVSRRLYLSFCEGVLLKFCKMV